MSWRAGVLVVIFAVLVSCSAQGEGGTTFEPFILNPQDEHIPDIAVFLANSRCSGVAVAPRVILTAAHCVPRGWATLPDHVDPKKIEGPCSCYPHYLEGNGADRGCSDHDTGPAKEQDLALCALNGDLPVKYIQEIDPKSSVRDGTRIMFAGTGCVARNRCSRGSWVPDRKAPSHGYSTIVDIPSSSTWIIEGDLAGEDSALCDGDSGGPAFLGPDWDKVVAINREGCLPKGPHGTKTLARSALTPLSTRSTIDWMCAWMNQDSGTRQIRGLDCPTP